MPYVRFGEPYASAISGRDVSGAIHPEDDAGFGAGVVADVRATDTVITEAEYNAEVARIQDHNAAIPEPAPPVGEVDPVVESLRLLVAKADGDVTAADVKEISLVVARRLLARNRL